MARKLKPLRLGTPIVPDKYVNLYMPGLSANQVSAWQESVKAKYAEITEKLDSHMRALYQWEHESSAILATNTAFDEVAGMGDTSLLSDFKRREKYESGGVDIKVSRPEKVIELSDETGKKVWIHTFPRGIQYTVGYGPLVFTSTLFRQVKRTFKHNAYGVKRVPVLLNHDFSTPAHGWLTGKTKEDDRGFWFEAELNKKGVEALNDDLYKSVSAHFGTKQATEDGVIWPGFMEEISLTAKPALNLIEIELSERRRRTEEVIMSNEGGAPANTAPENVSGAEDLKVLQGLVKSQGEQIAGLTDTVKALVALEEKRVAEQVPREKPEEKTGGAEDEGAPNIYTDPEKIDKRLAFAQIINKYLVGRVNELDKKVKKEGFENIRPLLESLGLQDNPAILQYAHELYLENPEQCKDFLVQCTASIETNPLYKQLTGTTPVRLDEMDKFLLDHGSSLTREAILESKEVAHGCSNN